MKRCRLIVSSAIAFGVLLGVTGARAEECPDWYEPLADHDGDGIPNSVDPCCYVTSKYDDTSADMCDEPVGSDTDQNGNGIPHGVEGMCCVYGETWSGGDVLAPATCNTVQDGEEFSCTYPGSGGTLVPCDSLLLYTGMLVEDPGGGTTSYPYYCNGDDCKCFTIGDYDGDGDTLLDPGPFDNCPAAENFGQINSDYDIWGDACDNCMLITEMYATSETSLDAAQCTMTPDSCTGDAMCVPWAFRAEDSSMIALYFPVYVGNFCTTSPDLDADGAGDMCDNCPEIENDDQADEDLDDWGDVCDPCPFDAEHTGSLEPGFWTDGDGDGHADFCDNCAGHANWDQEDFDADGYGDLCDNCWDIFNTNQTDFDSDTWGDACDNCWEVANLDQADDDFDGLGNVCDPCPGGEPLIPDDVDDDLDGILNTCDNCAEIYNPLQENLDGDIFGDACDECKEVPANTVTYSDGDSLPDECDNCALMDNEDQADDDLDMLGNVCDNCPGVENPLQNDYDSDLIGDACDNCPKDANEDQYDSDEDGVGEVCDNCECSFNPDQNNSDEDLLGDACDNCMYITNADQADADEDWVGDLCDNCPDEYNPEQTDENDNGIGDDCEGFVDNYTGAFSCAVSVTSKPTSLIRLLLSL